MTLTVTWLWIRYPRPDFYGGPKPITYTYGEQRTLLMLSPLVAFGFVFFRAPAASVLTT